MGNSSQRAVMSGRRPPGKPARRALKNSFTTNFIKPLTRACSHMRSVVITGASTGIGWACAKLLLDRGFHVFGSVRKQADADRLRGEFGASFTPLMFDVTDEAAVLAAAREVRAALNGETLGGLVNNAGIAVAGPVLELAADEFRRQMEVNFIGPVIATQAFGPLLGADPALSGPKGRIVMISSVSGKHGNPAPGAVKTPIWDKAEQVDISVYKNSPYFPALEKIRAIMQQLSSTGLPAEVIAAKVFEALTLPGPRVRYTLTPDPMQLAMAAMLPKRILDRIIARRLGLAPRS
jgi:hypothetical protein